MLNQSTIITAMWTPWLFLALLHAFSFVHAVQIQDAFKKDSLSLTYSEINRISLIDDNHILAAAPSTNQLIKIAVDDRLYGFAIDILDSHTDYKVVGDKLVTFSSKSPLVHVYDTLYGIYIDKIVLLDSPVDFAAFYNDGLLILGQSGSFYAWSGSEVKTIGKFPSSTSSFTSCWVDGLVYVAINERILCLNDQAENIVANLAASAQVTQFVDGLAVSKKEMLRVADNKRTSLSGFSNPLAVGSSRVVDSSSAGVTLNYIDENDKISNLETLSSVSGAKLFLLPHLSSVFVAAVHDLLVEVFDLKGNRVEVPFKGEFIDAVVAGDGSRVSVATKTADDVTIASASFLGSSSKEFHIPLSQPVPTNDKSILLNKPEDPSLIDKAHHLAEEVYFSSIAVRWLTRTRVHLSQFGRFVASFLLQTKTPSDNTVKEDKYGFEKFLAYYDDFKEILVLKDTSSTSTLFEVAVAKDGDLVDLVSVDSELYVVFVHKVAVVNVRDGTIISETKNKAPTEKALKLSVETSTDQDISEPYVIALKSGNSLTPLKANVAVSAGQFLVENDHNKLHAFKVHGFGLLPTWSFSRPDETILAVSKNNEFLSQAPGISKADRSVIYKYLNPNLIAVVTQGSTDGQLSVYLLDGITGQVLHVQKHHDEIVELQSVNIVQNDNWVVYTYFTRSPKVEQRIVSIDLFGDKSIAEGSEKSAFGQFNTTISTVSSKAYIFPEKIQAIESTNTKFGITIKSVIVATESGALMEIPHYVISARRIDERRMEPKDLEEFKVMPYEPVVPRNTHHVLNHKQKLQVHGAKILVKPTELESTAVVCVVTEANQFCSVSHPSSSYDILSENFDKITLLITLAVLLVVYVATKPLVENKKVSTKWVD